MACTEFEDLLIDYDELSDLQRVAVDAHLSGCEACQTYWQILHEMDAELTHEFAGRAAPPHLGSEVRQLTARIPAAKEPSYVPAVLDLIGGVAASGIVLFLAFWFGAGLQVGLGPFVAVGSFFVALSAAFACRTLAQS
jgi:anti-sigma factor RsiW